MAEEASATEMCEAGDLELLEPLRAEVAGSSVGLEAGGGGRQVGKEVDAAGMEGPEEAEEGGLEEARCSFTEAALGGGAEPSGVLQLHVRVQMPTSKAC